MVEVHISKDGSQSSVLNLIVRLGDVAAVFSEVQCLFLTLRCMFFCRLPYVNIFGGVSAMRDEHMTTVNGFSNIFWGWGGEDDDISTR